MSEEGVGKWIISLTLIGFGIDGLHRKVFLYDSDFDINSDKNIVGKRGVILNSLIIVAGLAFLYKIWLGFRFAVICSILREKWSA